MTNNEWLQQAHEGMPGAWLYQIKSQWPPLNNRWLKQGSPCWRSDRKHRLVPIVPKGCKPPPEEAYAYGPDRPGAVCLHGPVELPTWIDGFAAWAFCPEVRNDEWELMEWTGNRQDTFYLLDLTDPNAAEILALNRPDWTLPSVGPELPEREACDKPGPVICHADGDRCHGCKAYRTGEGICEYAPSREACDGNHGGPRCSDPECWNDDPAPALVIPADVWECSEIGTVLVEALVSGYSLKMIDGRIVGWRDE